jgi:hypothetical protein
MPKALFESTEGRARLVVHLLKQTAEIGLPYIPVVTPVAFNYTPGATSLTPAWRDALWHVRELALITRSRRLTHYIGTVAVWQIRVVVQQQCG